MRNRRCGEHDGTEVLGGCSSRFRAYAALASAARDRLREIAGPVAAEPRDRNQRHEKELLQVSNEETPTTEAATRAGAGDACRRPQEGRSQEEGRQEGCQEGRTEEGSGEEGRSQEGSGKEGRTEEGGRKAAGKKKAAAKKGVGRKKAAGRKKAGGRKKAAAAAAAASVDAVRLFQFHELSGHPLPAPIVGPGRCRGRCRAPCLLSATRRWPAGHRPDVA